MDRMSIDEYYLGVAKAVAARSTCLRRQYGAVIVKNREIIATGYNGAPRGEQNCCEIGNCMRTNAQHNQGDYSNCRSVHAEMNAIISACRNEMLNSTLYLVGFENGKLIDNCEPCNICKRLIKNAGISNVITCSNESFETDISFENKYHAFLNELMNS